MLDVKKLMTKIINAFAVKETTPTKYGSAWTSGGIFIYKRSGVVTVKCNGVAISALSARTQIATVPEGFRPLTECGALIDGTNVFWFVDTSGALKVNPTSARAFLEFDDLRGEWYSITSLLSTTSWHYARGGCIAC